MNSSDKPNSSSESSILSTEASTQIDTSSESILPLTFTDFENFHYINEGIQRKNAGLYLQQMASKYPNIHPEYQLILQRWINGFQLSLNTTNKLYALQSIIKLSKIPKDTEDLKPGDTYYNCLQNTHKIWSDIFDIIQIYLNTHNISSVEINKMVVLHSQRGQDFFSFLIGYPLLLEYGELMDKQTQNMKSRFPAFF